MAEESFEESKLTSEDLDKILSGIQEDTTTSKKSGSEENLSDLLQNLAETSTFEGLGTEEVSPSFAGSVLDQTSSSLSSSTPIEKSSIQVNELYDINVKLAVELGRTFMSIKDIILIGEGSIIELDKHVDDDVDILINDRLFGRGKLVILDEFYGVQITMILNPKAFKNL